jgi:soluble lytic murein transglycosylase-like protein
MAVSSRLVFVSIAFLLCTNGARGTCWAVAAERYQIPVDLLVAIATHESRLNALAIGKPNANGTVDIGLMQINSAHLPRLAAFGIGQKELLDPCINLHVGAWILRESINRHGFNWTAIGAYNAGSPEKRVRYAWAIYKVLPKEQGGVRTARR